MMKETKKANIYKPTNSGTQKVVGNATTKTTKVVVKKTGKK